MEGTSTVLLVHPGIYDDTVGNPKIFPPWGALSVGADLRAHGIATTIADLNGQPLEQSLDDLLSRTGADVVGFTTKFGLCARRFRRAVDYLRETRGTSIRIVAGGPLVSSFPGRAHPLWDGVDLLVLGEGESALATAILDRSERTEMVASANRSNLDDFDWALDWPPLSEYVLPPAQWPNMYRPGLHVASARGCTRRCTFCYLNAHAPGERFRYIGAEALHSGLRQLSQRSGATGFYFVDDCFIDRDGNRLNDFLRLNLADGSPFRYGCDVQLPDLDDPARLELMYEAGFRCLYVGVEAASTEVRKRLGKGRVSDVGGVLNRAHDIGLVVRASIAIGWPGETSDEMRRTIALIRSCPNLMFDAAKYLPLPGTPLGELHYWQKRRQIASRDQLLEDSFNDFAEFNDNYSAISDEEFNDIWIEMLEIRDARAHAYFNSALDSEHMIYGL